MGAGKRARRLHSFSRCERSDPSLNPSEARWRSQKKVTDGLMIDPLWVKKKERTFSLAHFHRRANLGTRCCCSRGDCFDCSSQRTIVFETSFWFFCASRHIVATVTHPRCCSSLLSCGYLCCAVVYTYM